MKPEVCRAARAMLGWSRSELSAASGVSLATISRYEQEESDILLANANKLQEAFRRAGIEFQEGGWLRLKKSGWQD